MEQTKISLKNLYLIAIISIGLIGLGVGSTFAMFTASVEINSPISLTYNIGYTYDILETADVDLAPGETKTITMKVTNDTDKALSYAFWYINAGDYDLDFGIVDGNGENVSTGTIAAGVEELTYTISVRNNGNSTANVLIGLSSSDDSIVFSNEMEAIPESPLGIPSNLFVSNLFTPTPNGTVVNNSITYDRDTANGIIEDTMGNLRYYGSDPNNYIRFNCEEYPDKNCELWRIIGEIDGKLKIVRSESIGDYVWDSSDSLVNDGDGVNQWGQSGSYEGAALMRLLNVKSDGTSYTGINGSLYYNSGSGDCYTGKTTKHSSCDFTGTGIKNNATKDKIANTLWHIGGTADGGLLSINIYSDQALTYEYGSEVTSNPSDGIARTSTWTGRIALPSPADVGYAGDFDYCTDAFLVSLFSSGNNDYSSQNCQNNDWIIKGVDSMRLLMPNTSTSKFGWVFIGYFDVLANTASNNYVFPALYLDTNVKIDMEHTGDSNDPYVISG